MNAYTVYWSGPRVQALRGLPPDAGFQVLFGGTHISQPSFLRAGVQPGDRLYIITVTKGAVMLCGAASVATIDELADIHPKEFHANNDLTETDAWVARSRWPRPIFFAALCTTCTSEALILTDSRGPFVPRALPEEDLRAFTYLNQRGERRPRGVESGRASVPLAFQGIYRLAPRTAEAFANLSGR